MNGLKKIKMGRDAILQAVKKNKPDLLPVPQINEEIFAEDIDLKEVFKSNVTAVGGTVKEIEKHALDAEIKALYFNAKRIVSVTEKSSLGTVSVSNASDAHTLEDIDLAIIEGDLGVSENGAVWVSSDQSVVRALPFITNDLVIILDKNKICLHMLQAYDLISTRKREFGVFISGPSKTADIEQSLVVGAHGAMSLTVLLI